MTVPFLFNDGVLTLILNGAATSVDQSHPNFKQVRAALKDATDDELLALVEVEQVEDKVEAINTQLSLKPTKQKKVTVTTDGVYYGDEKIDNQGLVDRIALLQDQGLPFDGMVKFIERLFENMSYRNRQELLAFIDRNGLTIDSEGYLICYKAVRHDYMDKFSGTIDNSPGQIVKMERSRVDDDFQRHCSKGLHAGALEYVYWYGSGDDRIVIVKIDPANVVSVPNDHSCQKLRTCEYEVIGDYNGELKKVSYSASQNVSDWYEADRDEDDEDDYYDWEALAEGYPDEDDDEELEDDFFNAGEVSSVSCNPCKCECKAEPKDEVYGVKPDNSTQAGRKFWNNHDGNGRFAPLN